jgi:hypothetical protein
VLGDTVTVTREKNKISVTSENAFSKRWFDSYKSLSLSLSLIFSASHMSASSRSCRR